ncbi:hypothetical protein MA6G0728R_5337 [Mycobacteroides abscessus 6G-0728-R]|nr:hypothetical protein MA6G0125S_5425 [Mycobacteroides abscessus 6G-0125-S]EIU64191.1 hypothetical protein MA6G0728S_5308 [Mycobacteroides abscessus 6G-0728-S]EIU74780.1 hypothetical protein MA6G1108_5428 [Mycobacteroides abscessus 6G-1108]EIV03057.1 hypothetical protein MA6G0728R_5337 [Mycobacteroides abscessus 6G-0728-R]
MRSRARAGPDRTAQQPNDGFIGTDTWIDLDDPELIRPHPEILQRYARRYN